MTDQVSTSASPTVSAAPVAAPVVSAPVVAAPVTAPATATNPPAPSGISESVASAAPIAPVAESAPVAAPVEIGKLDTTPKKTTLGESAVTEVTNAEGANAEVVATETVSVPLPTYEPWTLPEGVTADQLDKNGMDLFNKELGQFEALSKADHAETQKFAQGLVNLHINALRETVQNVNKAWQNQLDARQQGWAKAAAEHEVYGGNRFETSKASANTFISTHAGDAAQQTEFRAMLDETGAGDHPAMLGFLARLNDSYKEGKMVAATKVAPTQKLKAHEKAYGKRT